MKKKLTNVAQIRTGLFDTLGECLFTLTNPHTRIVELYERRDIPLAVSSRNKKWDYDTTNLLVGLICAFGVAYLSLEVIFLLLNKVLFVPDRSEFICISTRGVAYPDTDEIRKLSV